MSFAHLHLHTEYSMVDSIVRMQPLAEAIAALGQEAVAITDLSNLYGGIKFYQAMRNQGIKPIIGVELAIKDETGKGRQTKALFLCQNNAGFRSLSRLISRSFIEGYERGMPMVEREWIGVCSEGLIAIDTMWNSDLPWGGNAGVLQSRLDFWHKHFPERFYAEVCRVERTGEEDLHRQILAGASAYGLPVVATNDVRFLAEEDYDAHEARVCINHGQILGDEQRERAYTVNQYLRSTERMQELYSDAPEALENAMQIAMRCNLEFNSGEFSRSGDAKQKYFLPRFSVEKGNTQERLMEEQARAGLRQRLAEAAARGKAVAEEDAYWQRLEKEVKTIVSMGYAGYFLIVQDFIHWARERDIPVGPGRGSGAGSLVAWVLRITDVDPLEFDLLFERFLNPERVSLPDFDIDFCMERRDEVIGYVVDKYGADRAVRIVTFGTMAAKAVVRDVGRVLGISYSVVDELARFIPNRLGITLKDALQDVQELRERIEKEDEIRTLFELAIKLEGVVRNVSTHAGGIVIAPQPLTEYGPLYCEEGSEVCATQYDKDDVENIGLVKFDFLGLRTLTVIDWAMRDINALRSGRGEEEIDIDRLSLKDTATFNLLQQARTVAVFQLESNNLRRYMKSLRPESFDELVAMVALYRPGPLGAGMVEDFIDRKHGHQELQYLHPKLEPILQSTRGVIIYQEQVMLIAQRLAGYSLGSADLLRRAMGKKKPKEMEKQREIFVKGAIERGIKESISHKIFSDMEHFAGYGFNKSHSVAYALVAYQSAWLKCHYPAAFMAAVLTADMDNRDKISVFLQDVRSTGLRILPPSVNASDAQFKPVGEDAIRYGLGAIKGVGQAALGEMTRLREEHGDYEDLHDLCRRIDLGKLSRSMLEALIKAGAMDEWGRRDALLCSLPAALSSAGQLARNHDIGQNDMFGFQKRLIDQQRAQEPDAEKHWDELERLEHEFKVLGSYLSGNPMHALRSELGWLSVQRLDSLAMKAEVLVAGNVEDVHQRMQKKTLCSEFTLDDGDGGRLRLRIKGRLKDLCSPPPEKGKILLANGALKKDAFFLEGVVFDAKRVYTMEAMRNARGILVLEADADALNADKISELRAILNSCLGSDCRVRMDLRSVRGGKASLHFSSHWRLRTNENLLRQLRQLCGHDKVHIEY
ncbi:MAG: DNA polymerase III subunit alpha [Candidatus Eutrophobiaceae bacterium]